jgi:hypothetical protein
MIRAWRMGSLLVFIGALLLALSVAPGCCRRCTGTKGNAAPTANAAGGEHAGVTVTAPVPHAETIAVSTDNAVSAPSPPSIPRAIPIGKKPPPVVIPSTEAPQ